MLLLAAQATIAQNTTLAKWNFKNRLNPKALENPLLPEEGIESAMQHTRFDNECRRSKSYPTERSRAYMGCKDWDKLGELYWIVYDIPTSGYKNIKISSAQNSSGSGPREFILQYQIGNGTWKDVPKIGKINCKDDWKTAVITEVKLPKECEDQQSVSIRWLSNSRKSVNGGDIKSSASSRIRDILIEGTKIRE